jgi:hypothetical protein
MATAFSLLPLRLSREGTMPGPFFPGSERSPYKRGSFRFFSYLVRLPTTRLTAGNQLPAFLFGTETRYRRLRSRFSKGYLLLWTTGNSRASSRHLLLLFPAKLFHVLFFRCPVVVSRSVLPSLLFSVSGDCGKKQRRWSKRTIKYRLNLKNAKSRHCRDFFATTKAESWTT